MHVGIFHLLPSVGGFPSPGSPADRTGLENIKALKKNRRPTVRNSKSFKSTNDARRKKTTPTAKAAGGYVFLLVSSRAKPRSTVGAALRWKRFCSLRHALGAIRANSAAIACRLG